MMKSVEIAIIGAGPAGSTLAIRLAQLGHRVALLEKDSFPRDKLCGEFLSTESARCLAKLQCLEQFLDLSPATMTRTRLTDARGRSAILPLPGRAYGLSRRRLDTFLFELARENGVECFEAAEARAFENSSQRGKRIMIRPRNNAPEVLDWIEAQVVIAAYGRRTALDRQLKRPFFDERSRFVAFKQHHRPHQGQLTDLQGVVELYAFEGGYCGISLVEDGIINVCTMMDIDHLSGMQPTDWPAIAEYLSRQHGELGGRLQELEPLDRAMLAVAQIPFEMKEKIQDGILFAGDAAGMIAPLAGDGQAMAMESALALAELLDRHLPRIPYNEWSRLWRRRYARRLRLGQWLQKALIKPNIAAMGIGGLERWPRAGKVLIGWTRS